MAQVHIIRILLLTVLFYLICPFILIMFVLPIYIHRLTAKLAKQVLRKELGNIVPPLSNLFAVDKVYTEPTANLILGSVYEGTLTKELICKIVTEKWLHKRDCFGRLSYPELRQGLTCWFGFTFWENDTQFDISNHVRLFEVKDNNYTRGTVRTLLVNLVNDPFEEKRSPWEIIIIPGYTNNDRNSEIANSLQTLVLFKIHHSLVDGFSMLNLGEQVLEDVSNLADRGFKNTEHQYNLCSKFIGILRIPYFISKLLVNVRTRTILPGFVPGRLGTEGNRKVAFFNFNKIRMLDLKELKVSYGVTLTSLLLAGYVAGIKHILAKDGEFDMSTQIKCVIPVLLPGHPEKLRNYMSFATIDLPINESCPKKRLLSLNKSLVHARKSLDVLSIFYLLSCIGSFPSWLVRFFVRNDLMPFLLTNFPGPSLPLVLKGHRCTELFFFGGLLQGHLHAVCSCVGYEGNVHIAVVMDGYFLEFSEEMDEFLDVVTKALNELKNCK